MTRSTGSTELGPISKNNRASLTGLSMEFVRSTGDFSTLLVTRIFQFALQASEATNHSPVAILKCLSKAGAVGARMSGSGSSIFAIFESVAERARARKMLDVPIPISRALQR